MQGSYTISFRTTHDHLNCNKIPNLCLADFHIAVVLFWTFFYYSNSYDLTYQKVQIFLYLWHISDFFVVVAELNPKQLFPSPKQVYVHVRNVGTLVILHINRLIFKPAMKQSKGAILECIFCILMMMEDACGRYCLPWTADLSTPGWQRKKSYCSQTDGGLTLAPHEPPLLLSF